MKRKKKGTREERRLQSVIELSTQFEPLPLGHKYIEADYEVSRGVGINKMSRANRSMKKENQIHVSHVEPQQRKQRQWRV